MDTSKYTKLGADSETKSRKKGYSAKGVVDPDTLAQRCRNHKYKKKKNGKMKEFRNQGQAITWWPEDETWGEKSGKEREGRETQSY